jgi:hypothetical protein
MTPLTDDELGSLLTETFTAHEHLADPDRAVAFAASPAPPRHPGRSLLVAAAAVALVVGGTSYLLVRGDSASPITNGPPPPASTDGHQPPLPPAETDAGNLEAATQANHQIAGDLPVFTGAREVGVFRVPDLGDGRVSQPLVGDHTLLKTRFWLIRGGVTSSEVAQWYAAHPPRGFHTRGGPDGVGGEGDGTTWVDELTWDQALGERLPAGGTSIAVYSTRTSGGVGVRVTVSTTWAPARPLASFVQDVSSIDVRTTHTHYGRHVSTTHRSFVVTSPGDVLKAATLFDHLPGAAPSPPHSCPAIRDTWTDRIVFHTATGDVVGIGTSSVCGSAIRVSRDGHQVGPALTGTAGFLRQLGVRHQPGG